MPCYLPVQTDADSRELRALLYRANAERASEFGDAALDNSANIDRILALRAELAQLLGFASYADYSVATKMAQSPDEVMGFLRDLAVRASRTRSVTVPSWKPLRATNSVCTTCMPGTWRTHRKSSSRRVTASPSRR